MSSTPMLSGPTTPPIQAAATAAHLEPTQEVGAGLAQAPPEALHGEGGASLVQPGQELQEVTEPQSGEQEVRLPEGAQQPSAELQHDAAADQSSPQVCPSVPPVTASGNRAAR